VIEGVEAGEAGMLAELDELFILADGAAVDRVAEAGRERHPSLRVDRVQDSATEKLPDLHEPDPVQRDRHSSRAPPPPWRRIVTPSRNTSWSRTHVSGVSGDFMVFNGNPWESMCISWTPQGSAIEPNGGKLSLFCL
jgi:hypothetical protein